MFIGSEQSTLHGVNDVWFTVIYHGETMSEKQFKSPLVSCITCKKQYSSQGIFGHFFANHDPVGITKMAEVRQMGTDASFRNTEFQKTNKRPTEPKKLKKCHNDGCDNHTSNNKFCSKKCSAIVSNLSRTNESRLKQAKTLMDNKKKLGSTPKQKVPKPLKIRHCAVCGRIDETRGHFQSDTCSFCSKSLTYRGQCEFKFNLKNYPNEFDFQLLTEHGMFNPKNNPKGVSRDHMLSVQYGKDNRIDPKIISHPANCKLMLQGDNTRKQGNSCITYDELIDRITEWDLKYPPKHKDAGRGNAPRSVGLMRPSGST